MTKNVFLLAHYTNMQKKKRDASTIIRTRTQTISYNNLVSWCLMWHLILWYSVYYELPNTIILSILVLDGDAAPRCILLTCLLHTGGSIYVLLFMIAYILIAIKMYAMHMYAIIVCNNSIRRCCQMPWLSRLLIVLYSYLIAYIFILSNTWYSRLSIVLYPSI